MEKLENRILHGKRILVVEDERYINRLIQVNLQKIGCIITSVYDGKEAWTELNKNDYDMIITDIMMPRLDGHELIKNIRSSRNLKIRELPTIMLTTKSQDKDISTGWQQGCDAYLTKPFYPKQLILYVKRILIGQGDYSEGEIAHDL